jgi:hypothetical protein
MIIELIHLHEQEYEEIKTEHLWALQQTRGTEKIPEVIKFYNVGIYVVDCYHGHSSIIINSVSTCNHSNYNYINMLP